MLKRIEVLDKLNANTQKRLESGRKTQILSDIDRLKAAAHGTGGEEKRRLEEGIAQLNSDLARMSGLPRAVPRAPVTTPRASPRVSPVATPRATPYATPVATPKAAPRAAPKGRGKPRDRPYVPGVFGAPSPTIEQALQHSLAASSR